MASPWKKPETGVYYLYRQIPKQLQAEMGKRFVRKSLGTKDSAEASRLFVLANAEFQRSLDAAEARVAATAAAVEISPERARILVDRWLAQQARGSLWPSLMSVWWMEEVAVRTCGGTGMGVGPALPDDPPEKLAAMRGQDLVGDHWLRLVRTKPRSVWMPATGMVLGPVFETADPKIERVSANENAIMDAFNLRVVEENARFRAAVETPTRIGSRPRLRPDMRLRELLKDWNEAKRPRPQSLAETTNSVDDLIAYVGDIPVSTITQDMIMDYRDEAKALPARMPKADRALPFPERVALHKGSLPTVTATTLRKRIGGIQALLSFAVQERWITQNSGAGIKVTGYTKKGRGRRSFQNGELAQLFESDLFLKTDLLLKRCTDVSDVTLYWLFVLGGTSGARLEEVGQARVDDVKVDDGVLYIDIDDQVSTDVSDLPDKTLKTENSRRLVPVSDIAIDLGFKLYLKAVKANGQTLLFPDLRPNKYGKLTQNASQRANRYINSSVNDDGRLVFHSLRHKFKDVGRSADVQERILDQLCGHAPSTVGGGYGEGGNLTTLKRNLDKLRFEGVDWDRLRAAASTIDWAAAAAEVCRRASTRSGSSTKVKS